MKISVILFFTVIMLYSLRIGLVGRRKPSLTQEQYKELQIMSDEVRLKPNAVTITRPFIGWWFAWQFHTSISYDYAFKESDFRKYEAVYLLHQQSNKQSGGFNVNDFEVSVPPNSAQVFRGDHFTLYQLDSQVDWVDMPHAPPLAIGKVEFLTEDTFIIDNGKLSHQVSYDVEKHHLKEGEQVRIWGRQQFLGTGIRAEVIMPY